MEPPREIAKIALPAYQVEPPDLLSIEMLKLIPLPPYRVNIYDVLQIRVMGTMPDQPIDGYFLVEAEGIVTLGPTYGAGAGGGHDHRRRPPRRSASNSASTLSRPDVSVQLARTAGIPPVTGDYLVGPDGTINLKEYGTLFVAGKTVVEIRRDLENHLTQYFDSPEVGVEVRQFNSKVFYVITEGAGLGDNIRRLPITGNDTVMDALASVGGLSQMSSTTVWIARPRRADRSASRSAGGLRGDHQGRLGGHELPDHARRPRIYRPGQPDRGQQHRQQAGHPDRAAAGHRLVGHFLHPQHRNHGPRIQLQPAVLIAIWDDNRPSHLGGKNRGMGVTAATAASHPSPGWKYCSLPETRRTG